MQELFSTREKRGRQLQSRNFQDAWEGFIFSSLFFLWDFNTVKRNFSHVLQLMCSAEPLQFICLVTPRVHGNPCNLSFQTPGRKNQTPGQHPAHSC